MILSFYSLKSRSLITEGFLDDDDDGGGGGGGGAV